MHTTIYRALPCDYKQIIIINKEVYASRALLHDKSQPQGKHPLTSLPDVPCNGRDVR